MRARILSVLVLVMSFSAAQASGQDAPGLAKGSRVRLEAAAVSRKPMTGTILKLDQTSITLWTNAGSPPMEVRRDAITRTEVFTGRRSKAKVGALIGAVALAISAASESECSGLVCPHGGAVIAFAGAVGAGLGALVGSAFGKDSWIEVPSALRVSVAPNRKGGAISFSFAY